MSAEEEEDAPAEAEDAIEGELDELAEGMEEAGEEAGEAGDAADGAELEGDLDDLAGEVAEQEAEEAEEALEAEDGLLAGEEGAGDEEESGEIEGLEKALAEVDGEGADLDLAEPEEEAAPEPAEEEEEADDDDDAAVIPNHLQDAVEGSLRLKRMLSQDSVPGAAAKKRKLDEPRPIIQAKVRQILQKFQSTTDVVMKFVLDQASVEELQYLLSGNFIPNKYDQRKTAPELCAQHLIQNRERKLGGGSRIDVISAFKLRWNLGLEAEKLLRGLSHKDLRHVITSYDGSASLQDVIAEASAKEVEDEDGDTVHAVPHGLGVKVMSRFNRLELIDPFADAAVFGDANLTFSLNLCKHRRDFGHVGRVIATTFEEVETLRERYQEIDQSIKTLESQHAEVYHGVDCTRIAIDPRFDGLEGKLGAVYYNFPHSGAIQGFFDSNPMVNWRHENLMRLFFRALRSFVKPGGIVKVASNSGAVGVRYSYIVGSALENEFLHVETMPFMEWHLHRYGRSYGDRRDVTRRPDAKNNQSYNAQNANADMVYCFSFDPSGDVLPKQQIRLPPPLSVLSQCKDGPFKHYPPGVNLPARTALAKQLHERFLKEVSGIHVG